MSAKISKHRKQKQKDEMKQEMVVQVHKPTNSNASDKENVNNKDYNTTTITTTTTDESGESNRTYKLEDRNENYSLHTPSRDISVDEESQINSKILNLIETEMKRDINKHSHFTDSRPQSLSFYEDEKVPEELSGNLELLSPEERKHYKRRKEHNQMDTEERNAYNTIQDLYSRENDEIMGSIKKSKSRKKRHGDSEHGMGDSREMMIPKEKKKSKKKKRENSPGSGTNGKRKHRKRDEEHEIRNDITTALDELQDDVFENNIEEYTRAEKMKKSPRKSDKLYVQKKSKFEVTNRANGHHRSNIEQNEMEDIKRFNEYKPIEVASNVQKYWLPFTNLCHGLLGGLSLAHFVYLRTNYWSDDDYVISYAAYSDYYTCLFYFLCMICIVSTFDRYDLSHLDLSHLRDILKGRKSAIVIIMYLVSLLLHLLVAPTEDKISLLAYNSSAFNLTTAEIQHWNDISFCRGIFAFIAWIIIGLTPSEDLLYVHLKNMEKYIVPSDR